MAKETKGKKPVSSTRAGVMSADLVLSETDVVEILAEQGPRDRRKPFAYLFESRLGTGTLLFVIIASLSALFFVAFALLSWLTYPTPDTVIKLLPSTTSTERLQALKDLKAEWLQQTTSLGQMVVFGSLIPLLSTIIGYSLGSRERETH